MESVPDLTDILLQHADAEAGLAPLVPLVYDELRRVARGQLRREQANHSLQATALVHEVYLRLVNTERMTVKGRAHFFALAAKLMRQILVDHARRRRATKRGGEVTLVAIDEAAGVSPAPDVDVLALDEALEEMATFDPRQRDVVVLKFFGGLTIEEVAAALDISRTSVEREWTTAKAWLYDRLAGGTGAA